MTEQFDPFARMQAKVKESESQTGSGYEGSSIEQPEWFGLKDQNYTAFRIIGFPFEGRREPWHAKLVLSSDILTDNGFAIPFIWPSEKDDFGMDTPNVDKEFFLYRVHKAISKYDWDENAYNPQTKKNGLKIYKYLDTPAGQRFLVNHTEKEAEDSKFPINRPFLPQARVIIPVWVKEDSWCVEHNHTKLLTPKQEQFKKKDGSTAWTNDFLKTKGTGVPYKGFYTLLDEKIVGFYGHWDIDILGWRDSDCMKKQTPAYNIESAENNMIVKKYNLNVSQDRLDPDFVAKLNHYNLDEMVQFKVASYHKIEKHLSKGIKQVDALLDTTFHDELKDLVAEEKARWDAEKKDKESKSATTVTKTEAKSQPVREEKVEETPVEVPKGRTRQVTEEPKNEWTEDTIRTKCSQIYKFWNDLDQREQDVTVSAIDRFENNVPVMKKDAATAICGDDCKYEDGSFVYTEESISMCPACGSKYK